MAGMASSPRSQLAAVKRAVHACRPLALRYFYAPSLRVSRKADRSPVTAADRAVETRLRAALRRIAPGEPIIGEEFGGVRGAASTYWTIDPIDGTRAFARGLPTWCIMVGKVERGRPVLGVCDFPALETTIAVAPGVPAYEQMGRQTHRLARAPRPPKRVEDVVLLHGGANWWERSPYRTGFRRLIDRVFLERAFGDCYGFLWAFHSQADVVIEYGVKVWDMVPLAALAHATGRAMLDVRGRPSWSGPDTVMAAPSLARRVAAILRRK